MDITMSSKKRYTNSFMNGETVNYVLSFSFSFLFLIAVKQLLKTFIGLDTTVSCAVGFAASEIVLFVLQKYFVYRDNALNSTLLQILYSVVNAAVHLGIFAAFSSLIKALGLFDYTAWLAVFLFLLILDYPVSRILIFDCAEPAAKFKNGRIYRSFFANRFVFLSMAVALILMLFILLIFHCFPFGDTTVLRMDLYHQYGPLFVELFDRVTGGESFLYSWTSGGGSSFLGNFFNYLSSPFSAIIFLFDRDEMPLAITAIVTVKCVLSAGTFTFYIKKSLNRHSPASAAFGVFYAFSAYFLAYFWNVMWLDGMMMLPILALGIERIVNKGKGALYLITLVYIFYSTYYIGYMCCIFSVLYFLAYFFLAKEQSRYADGYTPAEKRNRIKDFFHLKFVNRGLRFAANSLLAGLLCAFFLLPVYAILTGSSATSDNAPDSVQTYFSLVDFIETHFAALETTIRSSGNDVLPNVYTSVLTILLVPLYMINPKIKFREKAVYVVLIAFFLLSFNNNFVNFFWHAFHFPNDLPYRFSFMYSFILLTIAFKGLMHIRGIGTKEIFITGILWLAFIALSSEMQTEKMSEITIYVTLAFMLLYAGMLVLIRKNSLSKLIAGILITALAFCEVVISDPKAFGFNQTQSAYTANYTTYRDAINYIENSDDSDYRTELCSLNTRMDACLYGYSGMSIFSSMAYEEYSGLQYSLGMYGNRINSYTYNTQTPVYNMMYNIKYLIYRDEKTRPSTDLYTKYYETENGEATVYQNDYYLPKAFCVNSSVEAWNTTEGDPFEVQENFFSLATGYSGVFTPVRYEDTNYTGMSGEIFDESGLHWIEKSEDTSYAETAITITTQTDGNLYLYVTADDLTDISVLHGEDSKSFNIETPYILDLGYYDAGETLTVSLDCAALATGDENVGFYAYSINKDILEKGYAELGKGAMQVTEHTDTKLTGTVTAQENSILYSSIPYDESWSVYIDGEKAETFMIGGCQLGVMIKPGEHTLEYIYRPKMLGLGAGISAATLICAAAVSGIKIRKSKKKRQFITNS